MLQELSARNKPRGEYQPWSQEEHEILLAKVKELESERILDFAVYESIADYLVGLGFSRRSTAALRGRVYRSRDKGIAIPNLRLKILNPDLNNRLFDLLKEWKENNPGKEFSVFSLARKFFPVVQKEYPHVTLGQIEDRLKRVADQQAGRWTDEEREFIKSRLGLVPFARLLKELNRWRWDKRLSARSELALKEFLRRQRWDTRLDVNLYASVKDLAAGIGVKPSTVGDWLLKAEYTKILEPFKEGNGFYFRMKNVREFLIRYPKLWDGRPVDAYWIAELLSGQTPGFHSEKMKGRKKKRRRNLLYEEGKGAEG